MPKPHKRSPRRHLAITPDPPPLVHRGCREKACPFSSYNGDPYCLHHLTVRADPDAFRGSSTLGEIITYGVLTFGNTEE